MVGFLLLSHYACINNEFIMLNSHILGMCTSGTKSTVNLAWVIPEM